MSKESTERFLRLLNQQNAEIAAAQAAEEAKKTGLDPVRVQRDEERREKWGQLRARSHTGKRPKQVRSVFGHVKVDP